MKMKAAQLEPFDLYKMSFGDDYWYWWLPTHPELQTNFYEKLWTKRQIREQARAERFEVDENHFDQDKKFYAREKRKSAFEKKIGIVLLMLAVMSFVFYFQSFILEGWYKDGKYIHALEEPTETKS